MQQINTQQFGKKNIKISNIQRLYLPHAIQIDQVIALPFEQMHYLTNVLRIPIGGIVRIFNNISGEYIAKIESISKKECHLLPEKLIRTPYILPHLSIAMSIIKQDKMIQAISMLTQLGITNIIPIVAGHSQTKELNKERITRCIIESAEQCERICIPTLHKELSLKSFLALNDHSSYICAKERADKPVYLDKTLISERTSLIIGPEGGFSKDEIDLLYNTQNVHNVSLGQLILRSETAAVTLTSGVQLLRTYA